MDFRWTSCRQNDRPFRMLSDAQAEAWDRDGFFLLEGLLAPDDVRAVEALVDPIEHEIAEWIRRKDEDGVRFVIREGAPGGTTFDARVDEITFTIHPAARAPELVELARRREFQDLVHDLVGDDVRLFWDQAVYKKPNTEASFPWHQDNAYAFALPQQYLTCWIPLTDATTANGCVWAVPGLHRLGTLHHELTDIGFSCLTEDEARDAVPIEAKVGDVVVLSSLTPHATHANLTGSVRKAYILQFAADGAVVFPDVPAGAATDARPRPANNPNHQFPVLGCAGAAGARP